MALEHCIVEQELLQILSGSAQAAAFESESFEHADGSVASPHVPV